MKLKFFKVNIEFEIVFLIVFLVFIFSNTIRKILFSFYMCYLFIIFHELAHLTITLLFGKEIENFKFSLSGVCIELKKKRFDLKGNKRLKKENIEEIILYLAGPISNIILAYIFNNNKMICEINIAFAIINLLPIFPLDGYNILDNLLELFSTRLKKREVILEILSNILIFILFFVGIVQLLFLFNPSIIMFSFYVFLIQFNNKKRQKFTNYGI